MDSYYNCLTVVVDKFLWLFQDKAVELTGEAIEEIESGFIIRTTQDSYELENKIRDFLDNLQQTLGENISLHISHSKEKNQDWICQYRNSVEPILCGKFYIRPSWSNQNLDDGVVDVIIDPALAFGSGHHGSTYGCLLALSNMDLKSKDVMDVGCGSGILSIAIAKSGGRVWCCDTDVIAVESSIKNADINQVQFESIWNGTIVDVVPIDKKFDIIVANILADIIVAIPIERYIKSGGIVILSGILDKYIPRVLDRFNTFDKLSCEINDEWATIVLKNS